jgi:hypothetical protein
MGNRIAKFEDQEEWIVYASVRMSCYQPIFGDELSAWLFAHFISSRERLAYQDEYHLGERISKFIRLSYGGDDDYADGDLYIDECADVTAGTTRGSEILSEFVEAFYEWRAEPSINPPVRIAKQTFDEFEADKTGEGE